MQVPRTSCRYLLTAAAIICSQLSGSELLETHTASSGAIAATPSNYTPSTATTPAAQTEAYCQHHMFTLPTPHLQLQVMGGAQHHSQQCVREGDHVSQWELAVRVDEAAVWCSR